MKTAAFVAFLCLTTAAACSHGPRPGSTAVAPREACAGGKLRVHFYAVGQGLSALVDLPDGRHVLVDTAESPTRAGCGEVCRQQHAHLMAKLQADLGVAPIDMLWITHPHSDHIGGALDVLHAFTVKQFADNGRDMSAAEISAVHAEASQRGVQMTEIYPGHARSPLAAGPGTTITAIVPSAWPTSCSEDRNACSILLRIDHCESSILFTGDEELAEESLLDQLATVTLLQVGHHGSDTSSGPAFLQRVKPHYAVISAGKPGEGMNRTYCHPRAQTVAALSAVLGGPLSGRVRSFDGAVSCKHATETNWVDVPSSDRLWATERDGDVVLSTAGDGTFVRE
jgi:competence protein ComEC